MELNKGVYIGDNWLFYGKLCDGLKDTEMSMFADATENIDNFRSNKPELVILEDDSCSFNVASYLQWIGKAIDPSKSIIILLTDQRNRSVFKPLFNLGVDDIYSRPANPDAMVERIKLLAEFRSLSKDQVGEPVSFEYKMPYIKRAFDIAAAGTALLLLSPVFLFTALLIRLESKGPVFYASKRVGTGFRIFDFYKFRSMDMNADAKIKDLKKLNQYAVNKEEDEVRHDPEFSLDVDKQVLFDDEGKIDEELYIRKQQEEKEVSFVKIKDDPRITRIGRFIRNTSIDELPQLFNVLKGDMSIVGNRPIPLYEAELLTTDQWSERFIAPAGLTGLWQVEKRAKSSEMSPEERKQLDNEYARSYTFWKDIRIIFRTFRAVFQSESV